jgi:hypothetical protein
VSAAPSVTAPARPYLWPLGLGLATLLLRLPFGAHLLNSFDAINYALALHHFDMRLSQPQAPGYPLYILLGRLFAALFGDDRLGLNFLSMIGSALAVSAMFAVGQALWGTPGGVAAGLLTGLSTVFWYLGEVAAPYTLDLAASALVGWLAYRLWDGGTRRDLFLLAAAWGVAGALRLQTLVFLAPLVLLAVGTAWRAGRVTVGALGRALALAAALTGVFFLAGVALSGGVAGFWRAFLGLFSYGSARLSGGAKFAANTRLIAAYLLHYVGEASLPWLLVGAVGLLAARRRALGAFLLLWLLPTLLFFLLVTPGNIGTFAVALPPLLLTAAGGWSWVWAARARWARPAAGLGLAVIVIWGLAAFLWLPERAFGGTYRKLENLAALRRIDRQLAEKLTLTASLPPAGTWVITPNFRAIQYYLPQYAAAAPPDAAPTGGWARLIWVQDGRLTMRADQPPTAWPPPEAVRFVYWDDPARPDAERRRLGEYSIWIAPPPTLTP